MAPRFATFRVALSPFPLAADRGNGHASSVTEGVRVGACGDVPVFSRSTANTRNPMSCPRAGTPTLSGD